MICLYLVQWCLSLEIKFYFRFHFITYLWEESLKKIAFPLRETQILMEFGFPDSQSGEFARTDQAWVSDLRDLTFSNFHLPLFLTPISKVCGWEIWDGDHRRKKKPQSEAAAILSLDKKEGELDVFAKRINKNVWDMKSFKNQKRSLKDILNQRSLYNLRKW